MSERFFAEGMQIEQSSALIFVRLCLRFTNFNGGKQGTYSQTLGMLLGEREKIMDPGWIKPNLNGRRKSWPACFDKHILFFCICSSKISDPKQHKAGLRLF